MTDSFSLRRRALALAALLLVGTGPARAEGPYLTRFDALALLPPPPATGSAEDRADRQSAYEVFSARTPADSARAHAQHEFDVFVFAPEIGPAFDADRFPKTAALFAEVLAEAKPIVDRAKNQWRRARPYVLEPQRFDHPADSEKSFGYPSGHSTRATLMAYILAQVYPQDRRAILDEARLVGWTRVEAGVHTPLDIYAGRVLGEALARVFLANPAFQADLTAAKAEAASAGFKP